MSNHALFPTEIHRLAAEAIVDRFEQTPGLQAVLLVNSCARGMGTPESDLDLVLLADPAQANLAELQVAWDEFRATNSAVGRLETLGRFTKVHLDWVTGEYTPTVWDDGGGPDAFEIEIGNHVVYSVPLLARGPRYAELRAAWMPYYREELRLQRLAMVQTACRYDLDFVTAYVRRGLYFHAFDALYTAHQEFLQALFIARRVYPLTYNKWIRLQVVAWLGLPELYAQLPYTLEVSRLESDELIHKAAYLRNLLDSWTTC